jgi:preprotein translocase subunit YajC
MFISNAYAQSASSGLDGIGGFLPIILMFVVLYFLMIRPQQKRQKEQKAMIEALAEGDEIVTTGGLLGTVTQVSENHVSMRMASGAEVFVQKTAVVAQLPKGTLESLAEPPQPAPVPVLAPPPDQQAE